MGPGVFEHLVLQIESMCAMESETDICDASEVARAVECFVEHDCGGHCADARALVLMTSQGLDSVGSTGVARRFLLHGTGLAKPSEWEVTHGETMWVIDLTQLTVRDDAPLELIFFTGLGIIVEALADIWDATQGRGVLGLRHVCGTAEALLGNGGKLADIVSLSDEIRRHCHDRLERLRRDRGWVDRPQVLNLDL
jgi:hypothetical protein